MKRPLLVSRRAERKRNRKNLILLKGADGTRNRGEEKGRGGSPQGPSLKRKKSLQGKRGKKKKEKKKE